MSLPLPMPLPAIKMLSDPDPDPDLGPSSLALSLPLTVPQDLDPLPVLITRCLHLSVCLSVYKAVGALTTKIQTEYYRKIESMKIE